MELVFVEVIEGKEWVAEFQATSDFNLHIERESGSYITLSQRGTERGMYDTAWAKGMYEGQRVIDCDFGALVYPKYIKVTSGSKVLKAVVTCPDGEVTPIITPKYEFVDMGLSVKWATCNVGASSPEEAGLYFAWGETEGYPANADGNKFTWSNYKYDNTGDGSTMSKYNSEDKITELEDIDDAAYVSDNTCRIPRLQEVKELINNTSSKWVMQNGVYGMKFTSVKNGNSIFFPASGAYMEGALQGAGVAGTMWCSQISSINKANAYSMLVNEDGVQFVDISNRCWGLSVRPVKPLPL